MYKTMSVFYELNKGFVAFFISILCFIYITGQLSDPYIRHDDWEFMTYLLPDMANHGTPWDKTLWEGRWTNYIWSFIARDFSVNANYLFFILGYSLFCWSFAFSFTENKSHRILIAISAFFCPAYADLSLWPATLSPSVWISAILLYLNYIYRKKYILLITLPILVMSYAPLVAVCFLCVMVNEKSLFKDKFRWTFIYYIGYVIGVLIIHFLNYKYHDFFGVKIAEWRNPNPVHSFSDLLDNIIKTAFFWKSVIVENGLFLIFTIALGFLSYLLGNKKKLFNIIFATFSIMILESAMSVYTGVDVPVRSIIWPWFFFVCIFAIGIQENNKYIKLFSLILWCVLFMQGSERWYGFYTYESKHSRFENVFGSILRAQNERDIYICGSIESIQGLGNRELRPLTLALWKKDGIFLKKAEDSECSTLINSIGLERKNNKLFYKL